VLGAILGTGDAKAMRESADSLKQKLKSAVICLGGNNNGKATIIVAVTSDLSDRLNAGRLIKEVAAIAGGRGGGRPDLAQAGGADVSRLQEAVDSIYDTVAKVLS
jgi:alanyl-tRNA synthetase